MEDCHHAPLKRAWSIAQPKRQAAISKRSVWAGSIPLISESFQAMARLCDFRTVIRAVFSSTLKSFAIMTGNLSSPSRNAYSRRGDNFLDLEGEMMDHHSGMLLRELCPPQGQDKIDQLPVKHSLPDLTPTCMTLELANRLISCPAGVAEDVYVKVGSFHFLADFVVVDFDVDPRVPLILRRSFLKTERALIDVFKGELTLRVGKEAISFNLDQTLRYSANYNDMTAKRIDVIDMACEQYSQEVLGFSDVIASGNPTPYYDLIVSTTSP
nr:reverse transcriptase domain-containing protein [Tanacetum cinerariifolium]